METAKSKKTVPPFFANTPDDKHCFQAAFRMILKYFLPDRNFSWQELEKMSAMLPSKATWPQQMLINLKNLGFDVVQIEGFDGHAFIQDGEDYLRRAFDKQTADWQINNSAIDQERRIYQEAYDTGVKIENRVPDLNDVKQFLDNGYLVVCLVNSRSLNGQEGYIGHSVVVYDVDAEYVTFHDPGLLPREARQERREKFVSAWAYPNDEAKAMTAIRYRGNDG